MFGKNTIDGLILEIEGVKLKDLLLQSQEGIANLYVNFLEKVFRAKFEQEFEMKSVLISSDGFHC